MLEFLAENGMRVLRITALSDSRHIFTHREWDMKAFLIRVDELEPLSPGEDLRDWIYVAPGETKDRYPIPSAFSAYTKQFFA